MNGLIFLVCVLAPIVWTLRRWRREKLMIADIERRIERGTFDFTDEEWRLINRAKR